MIDIIIPVFNKPELLRTCLASLIAVTVTQFKLYIADDNSTDPNIWFMEQFGKVIKNGSGTQGFPHNCNYAAKKTKSEFICLLNSDTIVGPTWLSALLKEMADPEVGVVGSKLIYPSDHTRYPGRIQHAGVARANGLSPYHIHLGVDPKVHYVNMRREINAVTFASVLIRRKVWNELGGLDEIFVGGQFEDVDFCWRTREAGYKVIYAPESELIHLEHGSGEEYTFQSSSKNLGILRSKWGMLGSDEELFK